MSEKIVNIDVVHDRRELYHGFNRTYDGYRIRTTEQDIYILINNQQDCCENWGYAVSEDNFSDYLGATLLDFRLTDTDNKTPFTTRGAWNERYLDAGGVQFVDLITDRGVLQFAVYNGHNGYYGHSVLIKFDNRVFYEGTL